MPILCVDLRNVFRVLKGAAGAGALVECIVELKAVVADVTTAVLLWGDFLANGVVTLFSTGCSSLNVVTDEGSNNDGCVCIVVDVVSGKLVVLSLLMEGELISSSSTLSSSTVERVMAAVEFSKSSLLCCVLNAVFVSSQMASSSSFVFIVIEDDSRVVKNRLSMFVSVIVEAVAEEPKE
ncbi:hypothetical protein FF38_12313 [Lucilia cuprina]|uniref:Uncharacterized protein n=1 Tax=Lucilia cuprina TaxID=7375 RepID=A0A0L0C7X8_LUCCU|nr:hypothetical protein FF38_12313 [Lucilia cuprina]